MITPRPKVQANKPWYFPKHTIHRLDNGLEVWLIPLPGQQVLDLSLVMPTPLSSEPENLEGVAFLCAYVADEGTKTHPAGRIGELLEDQGAFYDASLSSTATITGLTVPASRLDRALPIFGQIITEPDFAETDVENHKEIRLSNIDHAKANPGTLAATALKQQLFVSSRLSRPFYGRSQTIPQIQASDLVDFHSTQWSPQQSTLIVAGDFNADPLPKINEVFGSWRGHLPEEPDLIDTDVESAPKLILVNRPEAVQASLLIGCFGIDRNNPYWPALKVAVNATGGAFQSRLNLTLREEKGYTYGAGMSTPVGRQYGTVQVYSNFRTEIAAEAIELTHQILAIQNAPLDPLEVEDAKENILGAGPLNFDDPQRVGSQVAAFADAKLPPNFMDDYLTAVGKVTADEANEAYQQVVRPEKMVTVVVGNAKQLEPQLRERGFIPKVISVDELEM